METRRFVLALSLSLLVFLVYARFFAPQPPRQGGAAPQPSREIAQQKSAPVQPEQQAVTTKFLPISKGRDITVETDLFKAVINTAGGAIKSWELKNYKEASKEDVGIGVLYDKLLGRKKEAKPKKALGNVQLVPSYQEIDLREMVRPLTLTPYEKSLAPLSVVEYRADRDRIMLGKDRQSETLVLSYTGPRGIFIEKRLTFTRDKYSVDMTINTRGIDGYTLSLGTDAGISDKVSKDASGRVGIAALVDGKFVADARIQGIVANVAAAFVRQIDKLPLPVKSAPGFLVNRLLLPYLNEALEMVCQGVGLLGSIFTNMSVSTWYPSLAKPWFTPPPGVIPAVWTVLFTLIGVSLFLAWRAGLTRPEHRGAAYAFAAQFAANILWSAAFFGLQSPMAGLAVIALLWILILLTISRFYLLSREAALLLVPYLAWVTFASALNFALKVNLPGHWAAPATIAAAYGQLGQHEAAAKAVRDLLRLRPEVASTVRKAARGPLPAWLASAKK